MEGDLWASVIVSTIIKNVLKSIHCPEVARPMQGCPNSFLSPKRAESVSLLRTHLSQLPVEFCRFVLLLSRRVLTEEENKPTAVDKQGIMVPVHVCKEKCDW